MLIKQVSSARTRLQLSTIAYMTGFWIVAGLLQALYKSVNYHPSTGEMIFAAPLGYTMPDFLLINLIGPITAGIIAAPLIVFVLKDKLVTRSYLSFIGILGMVFFLYVLLLNTFISWIFFYREHPWGDDISFLEFLRYFLLDPYALRNILTWMFVGFFTILMLQISDKYGPGVLSKMIRGKYRNPKEEERIFMFIDLNDSTRIAEQLGNLQFFKLLSTYFADLTNSILDSHGEIYQYVGDEIVVTWTREHGLKNANCLRCYFDIEGVIITKSDLYLSEFGLIPDFKAALHTGKVIVGEIGIIKKDIAYSGDVLNTTSRILESCKTFNERLIISDVLFQQIQSLDLHFDFKDLGKVQLRGKNNILNLWAVKRNQNHHGKSLGPSDVGEVY